MQPVTHARLLIWGGDPKTFGAKHLPPVQPDHCEAHKDCRVNGRQTLPTYKAMICNAIGSPHPLRDWLGRCHAIR